MTSGRGFVIPIGGAEKKVKDAEILRRFIALSGGGDARIAVIPTASSLDDTGESYRKLFRKFGAGHVDVLPFRTRAEAADPEAAATLRAARGIFMTGGDQTRLSTILGGTAAAEGIREGNRAGAHVAGTSAGAAFLSAHMICWGASGPTPRFGMVTMGPGLGLIDLAIIDQHFRERDRIGRLMSALSFNPSLIGLGVDEDTAAFIGPDDVLEVVGHGGVTVLDPSEVTHSSMSAARRGKSVGFFGLKLSVLVAGDRYDLRARTASLD